MKLKQIESNKTISELIENVKNTKCESNLTGNILGNKTILQEELNQYYPYQCEFCGKLLTRYYPKIKHENITQKLITHVFCSKACRNQWVFLLQKIQISETIPNYIHEVEINEK